MRIGSFFLIVAVIAFLGLPIIGYQYYLKGLRGQTKALNIGTDELGDSHTEGLQQLKKLQQSQSAGTANPAATAKQADAMIKKLQQAQKIK